MKRTLVFFSWPSWKILQRPMQRRETIPETLKLRCRSLQHRRRGSKKTKNVMRWRINTWVKINGNDAMNHWRRQKKMAKVAGATSGQHTTASTERLVGQVQKKRGKGGDAPHSLHFKRRVIFLVTLAFLWKTGLVCAPKYQNKTRWCRGCTRRGRRKGALTNLTTETGLLSVVTTLTLGKEGSLASLQICIREL